jgi:hypothetical protein
MAWDIAENTGEWTGWSSALLVGVAGLYSFATWSTSAFPLLALRAAHRLRGVSVDFNHAFNTPHQEEDPARP